MPDWATIENGHFGIGSCVVLMNHRYSHEKQTRRQVSEDHRIHKSDAASQPSSAEMRTGVKDMHHKEHQAEITFGDTKATKEPVGNQGIGSIKEAVIKVKTSPFTGWFGRKMFVFVLEFRKIRSQ